MSRADFSKLSLSKFNERDHRQHAMKCIVACGIFLGFRSITEHLNLAPADIKRGKYEEGHEFEGSEWVGIGSLIDKAKKLTVHQSYVRDTSDIMKIPVLQGNDPSCGASAIWRMKEKSMPGQNRFYSYLDASTGKCFPKKPIGRNTISSFHKEAATILGVDLEKFLGGHAWRRVHVSINANNRGLNLRDGMESSRHSSVAAYMSYVMPDSGAEAQKMDGILKATGHHGVKRSGDELCDEEMKRMKEGKERFRDGGNKNVKPASTSELMRIEKDLRDQSISNRTGHVNNSRTRHMASSDTRTVCITDPGLLRNPMNISTSVMERKKRYEQLVDARMKGEDDDDDVPMSQEYDGGTYLDYSEAGNETTGVQSGTQEEFERLKELLEDDSEEEEHPRLFSRSVKREAFGRRQSSSDALVQEARALVREVGVARMTGVTSLTQARRPIPSENERTIKNLRMMVQQEKRLRRQERNQFHIDQHQAEKKLEEYAERIKALEESFVFDHNNGNFYRP